MNIADEKKTWQGQYYDGLSARRYDVTVKLTNAAIQITKDDQSVVDWPFKEITLHHGHLASKAMRLERGRERLNIHAPDFPAAFKAASPEHASHWGTKKERKKNAHYAALIIALIASLAALYLWIIPFGADYAAATIPPSWESSLGESVVNDFTDHFPQCADPKITKPVDSIVTRLETAAQPHPYKFKVYIVKSDMINAFAAPGGHIIIFTGLLEKTKRPEELAGVLGHEAQHILKRHATKSLFQNLSTHVLITLFTGGSSNTAGLVNTFATMRYSRVAETEADDTGFKLLQKAKIDPTGMAAFFKVIEKREKKVKIPKVFSYISTHPDTAGRISRIEAAINANPYAAQPLLPDVAWEEARYVCSGGKKAHDSDEQHEEDVYDVENGEVTEEAPKTE
ncbi:MAG: hypothetical protein A3J24_02755 [Deltaproteobacteria bacterium RIFCSPLOWO2_02_FULL_53_8]|nr:MAG: hypothetical protein A3J24_02755 [Deltaproteobacteria bacterium RIFCSPLOWO2_02_FULL_53_8]